MDWHHIVEQGGKNAWKFGVEAIHRTSNLIRVPREIHHRITGYYGSIQPAVTQSNTLTVRQWLSTQSYSAQLEFGWQTIRRFGGPWP
jgi:hypothetical protein